MIRFLIAGFTCLILSCSSQSPTAGTTPKLHTVMADGHPLAVWEKSAGDAREAILLVHGRTWSALPDFDLQVEGEELSLMDGLVEAGYSVFAVDLRGYGETKRDASGWLTPNRAADDVAIVLEWIVAKRKWDKKPHLFGWSMGSTVSQLAVQRHPGQVASLTWFGYWFDEDMVIPADEPGLLPLMEANTKENAMSDFITPGSISPKAIEHYATAALKADPIRVDLKSMDQYNALDAGELQVPVLIMAGEFDPIATDEIRGKLIERLKTSHIHYTVIRGGDHAAFLESSRSMFLRSMIAFFQTVP